MPIVPRLDPARPLANAPAPVLDRERRPTVNRGTVIARLERLGDAAAQPMLPKSLAEPVAALGRVGESIARAGSIMGAIAHERQEAIDKVETLKAQRAFQQKKSEFEAWRAEHGQLTPAHWIARFDKMMAGFTPLANDSPISKRGRALMDMELGSARELYRGDLKTDSEQAIFGLAKRAAMEQANMAYEGGDRKTGDAFIDEATGLYIHSWEAPGIKQAGEEKAKAYEQRLKVETEKAVLEEERAIIAVDPFTWKQVNTTPWQGREGAWQQLRNYADARAREITGDQVEATLEGIYSGAITTEAEIDAIDLPSFTLRVKQQMRGYLADYNKEKFDVNKREHGDAAFVREWVAAKQIDFNELGTDAEQAVAFAEMLNRVKTTVPDDRVGEITQLLHQKFGVSGRNLKPPPEIQKFVDDRIESVYKAGGFGALTRYDAAQLKDVPDVVLQGKAMLRRAEVTLEMRKWSEQNLNATTKEVDAKLGQIFDGSVADEAARTIGVPVNAAGETGAPEWMQFLERYNGPAVQPDSSSETKTTPTGGFRQAVGQNGRPIGKVTSYGYVNDETPDSNSTAGIGAWVSKKEQELIKAGKDTPNKLREGDLAVSRDVERALRDAGIREHDTVIVAFTDGSTVKTRWMDRTAANLTGRVDFYRAGKKTKHPKEGQQVSSISSEDVRIDMLAGPAASPDNPFPPLPRKAPFSE